MHATAPKCVYVLQGPDDYLRRHGRRQIVQDIAPAGQADLTVVELEGSADLSDVLDELRTPPLLTPKRLVVVADADRFIYAHCRQLLDYLDRPGSWAVLLLIVNAWPPKPPAPRTGQSAPEQDASSLPAPARPAGRKSSEGEGSRKQTEDLLTSLVRKVSAVGQVIDCGPPDAGGMRRWLGQAAAARGKSLAPQAADAMVEYLLPNLAAADNELDKLAAYVGARTEITRQDVEELVSQSAGPAAYALTDAIGAGDAKAALAALDALLVRRGDEFGLLGLIAARLRWRFGGKGFGRQRPVTPRRMAADFRRLLGTDLALKSGADAKAQLQWLIVTLCG